VQKRIFEDYGENKRKAERCPEKLDGRIIWIEHYHCITR
jgi:hypothetical protein